MWVLISGVPGVLPERFAEGMDVKHCALSLVGEPIMYPEISNFVHLLHEHGISTFLVTNAQFPEPLRYLVLSCNSCSAAPHSPNCHMWV